MARASIASACFTPWRSTTLEEIKANYTWPAPDWWDYSGDRPVRGKEDCPIHGGGSEPFLIYAQLRGLEQAYMDLLIDPDFALDCLDKLFDLAYTETRRIYDQIPGKVTMSYVAEDLARRSACCFHRRRSVRSLSRA